MAELDRSTVRAGDGAELAVQRLGEGPALLMLPGQSNSHRWWNGLREHFSDRFTTVTFDYRGTGTTHAEVSRDSIKGWSTRSFADDARHVLAGLGISRPHIYGASMGGRVAQWLAIDSPDLVDRLVLACTSPGGPEATERSDDVRKRLGQRDPQGRLDTLIDLFYTPAWREKGLKSCLLGDAQMSGRARSGHLHVSGEHDASARLGEISAPALIMHGDEDLMAPVGNAHVLHREISDSSIYIYPGGRHGFFDEFSDEVSARVHEFLV